MTSSVIGGYRLVRMLGTGARAAVHLGVAGEAASPVALKCFGSDVEPADGLREVAMLARSSGPHVVRLLDVATDERGSPVLVLERLPGGSLADLLAGRSALRAGEVVTVAVPVVRAVARMHSAGVVHGSIGARSILFSEAGEPTLACFGSARSIEGVPTEASRDQDEGMLRDLDDLRSLVCSVLAVAGATDVIGRLTSAELSARWLAFAESQLFSLAQPEPVDIPRTVPSAEDVVPRRPRNRRRGGAGAGARSGDLLVLPAAVRRALSTVRPRFWAIGAAGAAAAVAAVIALSATSPSPSVSAVERAAATSTPTDEQTLAPADPASDRNAGADDPLEAIEHLLELRARCYRDASILCLDSVTQLDSAAMETDRASILAIQEGRETDAAAPVVPRDAEFSIEESLGGAVLVRMTTPEAEPASVLMVRTEAGWRIRDYVG